MVKLSQQLQDAEATKTTRTQRVAQKQEFEKEKRTFIDLKTRAKEKQKEFEGISSIDEYEQKYNLLDQDLKQFFHTPNTLRVEKTERIEATKTTIQEKHAYADSKIAQANERRAEEIRMNDEWYSRVRDKKGTSEEHKKYRHDIEDDWEERIAKWEGYKKGLNKGLQELNQNKDIPFQEIEGYAQDVSNYEEDKKEASNKGRKIERDQELERRKLEEAGYKPQVIEKSFKGKPTAVQIGFYNPKTKDWVSGTEYKIKAPVDVSGLKKLGYSAPQQRQIQYAGKIYEFQSRIGIYKDPSGEIVTPYEKTGVTEDQLIKQQQDIAFEEWKSKPKPIDVPFEILDQKDLPIGYGGQQTISTQPIKTAISEQDYYRDIKGFDFGISKVVDVASTGFSWVKQRVHWDFSIDPSLPIAPISVFKFGTTTEPTVVEKAYKEAFKDIEAGSQSLEEWVVGKERISKFETGIEEKYQLKYQTKFEKKYMENIIYERTTFEDASKEFEESEEAKLLQKKFAKEYGEGYRELQTGRGFWKGTVVGGLGQTSLGLSKFLLKATGDPASATLTVGAVSGGLKVLKTIPPIVSKGLTAGLGIYGGMKLFDPSSTYIEKGGGLLMLSIAGASLGYGTYRYLRSPVVKTIKIKAPKQTLKSSEVIGKDIKILTDKGMINKVLFENQKISQTATAGRRTIIITKGRVLLENFWKELGVKPSVAKISPIYQGIPTQQLGTIKYYERFGGLIKIGKRSGYQKAFIKLTDYGYTSAQAKATLKYVAPRVTEQYLSKGILTVKGSKAIGEFEYLTKRPVIDVDKTLGIKTRGGKTIKDIYNVERKLITIEKGKTISKLILEQKTHVAFSLKGKKLYKFTEADFSRGIAKSKISKELKGYEYLGKDVSGIDIFKEAKYKDVYSISATKKILPVDKIVMDASKTKLINKILDLRKAHGKTYFGGKKTPFKITFADDINKIDDIVSKPTPSSDISKLINKLDDIGSKRSIMPKISKYYGAGQYEQSFGGLDPQTSTQLQQQLKVAVIPDQLKIFKLKDLIKIKQLDVLAGMNIAQLTAIKTATGLKSDIKHKTDLKTRNDLKMLLKADLGIKTAQLPALKTSPVLKSQIKTILDLSPTIISPLTTPLIIRTPTIPKITPPMRVPIILPFLKAEIRKRTKSIPNGKIFGRAYIPDFTSRALGLKPETITEKQAMKKLKKLLTGLEIRRGVKLK